MSAHVEASLAEYALGMLDDDERARVDAHLSSCVRCAAEASAFLDAASASVAAALPSKQAPSYLRARLLASAEAKGRLAHHAAALAKFFELSVERARALLDMIDEPAAWEPNEAGIGLIHLAPGPRLAALGADAGLVRFPAGMEWPLHKHVGDEFHLFLEGGIREHGTERVLREGDVMHNLAGSQHSFTVLPERDCVTAVILMAGIELPPGTPVRFD